MLGGRFAASKDAGLQLAARGDLEWHGFAIAKVIRERERARLLTAHGTLYKALDRMERGGTAREPLGGPAHCRRGRAPPHRLYRSRRPAHEPSP